MTIQFVHGNTHSPKYLFLLCKYSYNYSHGTVGNGTEDTTSSDVKSAKDKLKMPCGQIKGIQPKSLYCDFILFSPIKFAVFEYVLPAAVSGSLWLNTP